MIQLHHPLYAQHGNTATRNASRRRLSLAFLKIDGRTMQRAKPTLHQQHQTKPDTKQTKQVYKGRRRCTGQITAMKFIVKQGKSDKDVRSLRQEIEILRGLRHENIVQMLDAFETRDHFVVVMGALTG
jgi:hypothetical protein